MSQGAIDTLTAFTYITGGLSLLCSVIAIVILSVRPRRHGERFGVAGIVCGAAAVIGLLGLVLVGLP